MGGYNPKDDLGAQLRFLGNSLDKATSFLRHVDSQANILIGISSGLFIFSISQSVSGSTQDPAVYILAIFAAFAAISGLLAVHPPRYLRKQGQKESLLYHRTVSNFKSPADFARALEKLSGDQSAFTRQYATEIYNIYRYTYAPKRRFYNLGRNLLLTGFSMALAVIFFERLFAYIR